MGNFMKHFILSVMSFLVIGLGSADDEFLPGEYGGVITIQITESKPTNATPQDNSIKLFSFEL